MSSDPAPIFISYARSDGRDFAEVFERRLEAEGLHAWRDLRSMQAGDILPQVLRAIEGCRHLVLIHADPVSSASYSPDGGRILSACLDKTARIWDAATAEEIGRIPLDAAVTGLAIHGTAIALGDALGRIHVFDAEVCLADGKDPSFALFELYLATAEKISDRRAQANAWMLSVNSALVGLYGYLQSGKASVGANQSTVWLWAIPLAGAIVCIAWVAMLTSYRQVNRAKFAVLQEIEASLPHPVFGREQALLEASRRRSLSVIETFVPVCFAVLYLLMAAAAVG